MRRTSALVIVAWLLGIATAVIWPNITTERVMLASALGPTTDVLILHDYARDGWVVTNATADRYYVLERPRFRLP